MLKKLSFALAAILSVSLFASCVINTSDDGDDDHGIDYKDHGSDWSIMVTNETQQKLVLFKGAPSSNQIIGGVKANAKNQHMAKNATVFGKTSSDFIMYAVKEKDYLDNKDKLEVLDDAAFTTLYAYYNADGTNDNVYTISSALGGNYYVTINNNSGYNVELRNNGINGPSIAYCGKGMYEQHYYWAEGDYLIFPVFRKFNKTYGEIISVAPTDEAGDPIYETVTLKDQPGYNRYDFMAADWKGTNGKFEFAPSAAYLKIVNNSGKGISLYPGKGAGNVFVGEDGCATTGLGAKYITTAAPYNYLIFTFNLQQLGGDKSNPQFEKQVTFQGFQVGNAVKRVKVEDGGVDTFTIKAGHMQTLIVSADGSSFKTAFERDADSGEILDYEVNFEEIDDESVR